MLFGKKLIAISIALVLIFSGVLTVLAADKPTVKVAAAKQNEQAKRHSKLISAASKLGIDAAGLTDKQISAKVNAALKVKRHDRLLATAKSYGIDTTGLSDKEISEKVNALMQAKRHIQLLAKAVKLGIDTTGMTDKEIAKKLQTSKNKDRK